MNVEMQSGFRSDGQAHFQDDRFLNEIAQGLRSFEYSIRAFDALQSSGKLRVLSKLAFMASEAGANAGDARQAIAESGLPASFHPLFRPGRRNWQGVSFTKTKRGKLILDEAELGELRRQYEYIMRLFTIADEARRFLCGGTCHHWWHHLKCRT